jgi:hypothetical protein
MAAFKPLACIAIDLGTSATGYCLALKEGRDSAIRVLPFKPGDRASQATEKNLTAVLLEAGTKRVVGVGRDARRRFYDMETEEQRGYIFLTQFKMGLSPANRGRGALRDRVVHGEGADVPVLLMTAFAKLLEFIRQEACDRCASIGIVMDTVGWVITVPAIWDEAGKMFMREAAVQAGIVPNVDSDLLQLALEPGALALPLHPHPHPHHPSPPLPYPSPPPPLQRAPSSRPPWRQRRTCAPSCVWGSVSWCWTAAAAPWT